MKKKKTIVKLHCDAVQDKAAADLMDFRRSLIFGNNLP